MKLRAWHCALALLLPLWAQAQDSSTAAVLAFSGARIIDGWGGTPIENGVVVIRGNKIEAVGPAASVAIPAGARTVDVNGMTVLPGLWESHGHLMHVGEGDPDQFPANYAAKAKEVMGAIARLTLLSGITTFRDTGGPLDEQLALRADIEAGRALGPRLFIAGPILHQVRPDPREPRNFKHYPDQPNMIASAKEARAEVEALIKRGVDQIKVYGFWDLDILREVTATAHAHNIGVDADVRHIVAYRTAIQAGVDRLHHVFTADALSDYSDEDMRLLVRGERPTGTGPMANILRGPYIVPTIEMRQAYARAASFPELLEHPRFAQQLPPDVYEHLRKTWSNPSSIPWGIGATERVKVAKEKLARFIAAGGREQIVAGTDAGSPLNVHPAVLREIRNLREAGLTPMEAIQAATLRPAQMQGVLDKLGTLTPGKLADLVIVDGDPLQDVSVIEHRLVLVVKDGVPHEIERTSVTMQ